MYSYTDIHAHVNREMLINLLPVKENSRLVEIDKQAIYFAFKSQIEFISIVLNSYLVACISSGIWSMAEILLPTGMVPKYNTVCGSDNVAIVMDKCTNGQNLRDHCLIPK